MPKIKTRSSVKKRVKITGSGKIRLQKSARNHLLINKSERQKNVPAGVSTSKGNEANIRSMLPYGK